MDRLDASIKDAYLRFNRESSEILSADKIGTTPALLRAFMKVLHKVSPGDLVIDSETVGWRLLTLRKRGANNNGLPRLSRNFHGRQSRAS